MLFECLGFECEGEMKFSKFVAGFYWATYFIKLFPVTLSIDFLLSWALVNRFAKEMQINCS